jgi:glucuronoarabinoxylan endo-1,4-beta-xylanase
MPGGPFLLVDGLSGMVQATNVSLEGVAMFRTSHRSRVIRSLAGAAGLLTLGWVVVANQLPASAASTVSINAASTFQTIDGFGMSEAFSQANSIRTLAAGPQRQALDLLFNTSTGAGFSILRSLIPSDSGSIEPNAPSGPNGTPTYVWSGNDAQDQGQLWLAKQAKTYGVTTFYNNAWSAPGFMKTNGNEANGGSLCGTTGASCGSGDWRQAYANYLVQHAKFWSAAGVTPTYLGFVNEPSLTATYSSMLVNASQATSFLSVLGPTLSASGLSTKATCCDTLGFNLLPAYVTAVGGNSAANAAVGLFTSHGYSNAPTSPVSTGGRHLWETEWSVNGSTFTNVWDSTNEASGITWAQRIHNGLAGANLNAFLYFWGISSTSHDSSLIGLSGSTLTPTKRYYALSNYSRFIRPGAVRIAATGADANLQTTAFRNSDGSVVIVTLNTASSATSTTYSISGTGSTSGTVTPFLTNTDNNVAAQPSTALSGGSFSVTVPARSLVTYVVKGGGTTTPPTTPPTTQPTTTPPVTTPPQTTTTTTTTPPVTGACSATYRTTNSWPGGFQAEVTVTAGNAAINGWTVRWTLSSGQAITQLWNGNLATSGSAVSVGNLSYNGSLAASASTTFGFTANGTVSTPAPTCSSP